MRQNKNALWAFQDWNKTLKTMGLTPTTPEKAKPLTTVENLQKMNSKDPSPTETKEKGFQKWQEEVWTSRDDSDFLEGWNSVKSFGDEVKTPISDSGRTRQKPFSPIRERDQDRLFFEGFYDIDGATTDYEREVRTSQLEKALRDIGRRSAEKTRAEFHAAPTWYQPLKESDDDTVKAGREYAKNIVEDKFNQGYLAGWDKITHADSPIGNSTYLDIARKNAKDHAKADFIAGVGAAAKFAYDLKSNIEDMDSGIDIDTKYLLPSSPKAKGKLDMLPYVFGAIKTVADGGISDIGNNYEEIRKNNARAKQSDRQYEYLHNNELKYLVDDAETRERFINTLEKEVSNLRDTENAPLSPGTSETYKREVINYLMRIIFINRNYDKYSTERNSNLRNLLN